MSAGAFLHGQIVVSRFEYLKRHHGSASITAVLEELSAEDQGLLRGIDREAWYPFSTLMRLDRAIAAHVAAADEGIYLRLGQASSDVRSFWLGQHAALIHPHGFFARIAEEHRRFHNFGRAEYIRISFGEGELRFREYPETDPIYCLSALGYLRHSLEQLTGAGAEANETACQCRGDEACVFRLRWGAAQGGI